MRKSHIDRLLALNAQAKFRSSNVTYVDDERTGRPKQTGKVISYADIVDQTVNEIYATGQGDTEDAALEDALNKAEVSAKPLTPAQKADAERRKGETDAKDARIKQLEAELAEARAGRAAETPLRPRSRKRQSAPEEAAPASA